MSASSPALTDHPLRERAAAVAGREQWTKAVQDAHDPMRFVVSTEDEDRYGDVIDAAGWNLKNFKRNPIALFNHSSGDVIGTWDDVRVDGGKLHAKLRLAEPGTSPRVDTVRALLEQRILRAASVGFRAIKVEPISTSKSAGLRFKESELLEISVVSIPANPHALAVAKRFGLPDDDMATLFAKPGDMTASPRTRSASNPGKSAALPAQTIRGTPMSSTSLADRLTEREGGIVLEADRLTELTETLDQLSSIADPDADQQREIDNTREQIAQRSAALANKRGALESMKSALAAIGTRAEPVAGASARRVATTEQRGMPASPALVRVRGLREPADLLFRAASVVLRAKAENRSFDELLRNAYGGAQDLSMVVRAVTEPARTDVAGWAMELVQQNIGEFLEVLRPGSVFFNIPFDVFNFGRGLLKLPSTTGIGLAGSFVGEGMPIPVRQAQFASVTLTPHKLGVITTFTREIQMLSDPAIEPLLRNLMTGDTRQTIDALFLDNTAASALRPAGLQNLAGAGTASSGTSLANIMTDLRVLTAQLTNTNMGIRPVWIMHTERMIALQMLMNASGSFVFADTLSRGMLLGYPVIASTVVPPAVVFLMDAAQFAAAYDTAPQIDASEQATLHMESTAATLPPTAGTVDPIAYAPGLSPGGTPGTAAVGDFAQPVRSLFQTASMALRLLWDLTWAQRRAGAVVKLTGVAW